MNGESMFGRDRALVGMVHALPLPGTPRGMTGGVASPSVAEVCARAVEEARVLVGAGFDALLLENMHDVPYLRREVGPEIVASMTAVGVAVRSVVEVPIGIQVLAGANRAALAVAQSCGASFIRAEGFVFASVADEGLMDGADAGTLLRYRRSIGAEGIGILADIKKKHSSHAITSDVGIGEMARAAEFCGADGVIVTGSATGEAARMDDVVEVRGATGLPVAIGSGVDADNIGAHLAHADAVIVGSSFKVDGDWRNGPDAERVRALVRAADRARA